MTPPAPARHPQRWCCRCRSPVFSHDPDIAGQGGRLIGRLWNVVEIEGRSCRGWSASQSHRRRTRSATDQSERIQFAEFEAEQFIRPAGVQAPACCGRSVGPSLRVRSSRPIRSPARAIPSLRAANSRPWPGMMPLSPSTRTWLVQRNSRIEAAICATCASEWAREFLA